MMNVINMFLEIEKKEVNEMAKKEAENTQEAGVLKVTLVFAKPVARLIRQQAKVNYLPITQYLKSIILRHLDQQ